MKRPAEPVSINSLKKSKITRKIITKTAIRDNHVVLKCDMKGYNSHIIFVPEDMVKKLSQHIQRMKTVKIQFGIHVEFIKEGTMKDWFVSNKAIVFTSSFIDDGIAKLNSLMEQYMEGSSGYKLNRILEIQMTINKYAEIINLSGMFILHIYLIIIIIQVIVTSSLQSD